MRALCAISHLKRRAAPFRRVPRFVRRLLWAGAIRRVLSVRSAPAQAGLWVPDRLLCQNGPGRMEGITFGQSGEHFLLISGRQRYELLAVGVNLAGIFAGDGFIFGDWGLGVGSTNGLREPLGLPGSADCRCRRSLWGEPAVERAHSPNGAGRVPSAERRVESC